MSGAETNRRDETHIVADPALPTILITREFGASPELVFRAYTDPDLVIQWLGPRRLTMRIDEYDAHTGGSYRYVHREDDGTEYGFRGVFHEVRLNERLVQTFAYDGFPDGVSLETTTFEDLGGRTRVTTKSLMDSIEARDSMIKSGMQRGVREGYELLDELLSGRQSGNTDQRTEMEGLRP
ncbi:SRPBCC family protein [Streptomyces sp. NBC_00203]|uniref:SRPBCC family protein n=1 Tax=Streptomyces sp. NBC_00203 TaxID=2975680 RepID=UPI00324C1072